MIFSKRGKKTKKKTKKTERLEKQKGTFFEAEILKSKVKKNDNEKLFEHFTSYFIILFFIIIIN